MIGAILTLIVALAFAISPFLVPDFAGFAPDRFPVPQNEPPVQPAGYAFAIWGLIYLWLLGSAAYGLWQRAYDEDWARMRVPLILSMALGAAWLPVANNNPLLAAVMIWAMLLAGLAALFRAPEGDRLLAAWPVGLYCGWLSAAACVATGLNIAGYGLLNETFAALAMIALAIGLAAAIQLRLNRAPTYGAGVVWALVGIYVANETGARDVAGLAFGGAIAVGALALWSGMRDVMRARG